MDLIPTHLEELLFSNQKRLFLVIGASDTGKSTFVESISRRLSTQYNTGVVDLDIGQSTIGPPTTQGWARCHQDFSSLSELKRERLYFTGSVTPVGSLLPVITGAKLITEDALRKCEKVIVDTTGLISEPAGRVLKQFKIEILRPDVIIAFQRERELQHIIEFLKYQQIETFILRPSSSVIYKTPSERAEYRFKKMMEYLEGASLMEFQRDHMGFLFTGQKFSFDNPSMKNRIVSLRNSLNEDMAIGVIEAVKADGSLLIRAHRLEENPSTIVIGKAVMDKKERAVRNFIPLI